MSITLRLLSVLCFAALASHGAAAPRVVDAAELDRAPERVSAPPLVLPEAIRTAGTSDTVTMTAIVGPDGRVVRVEDVHGATPETTKAASAAVRGWEFNPCFVKGEPVSFRLPVAVAVRPDQDSDAIADTGVVIGDGFALEIAAPNYETIPEYPSALRETPVDGFAMVNLLIDAEGRPSDAVVEYASRPEFSEPAAAAVLDWSFTPTKRGGSGVATRTSVSVLFQARSATWDAATRERAAQLGYYRSFDEGPREKSSSLVVYPYEALLAGKEAAPTISVLISPEGAVEKVEAGIGADPDFVAAARASLATWTFFPATKAGRPVFGLIALQMVFRPDSAEFEFDATTLELISSLRDGTATIYSLKEVEQMPKPVKQVAPVLPADHEDSTGGEALIETIIDTAGRSQLPRIVRATNPGLGWAAATAVAQWRFEPARKGGQAVTCRARVPVRFAAPARSAGDSAAP